MEANVRSFLSMRGKVNKGIRQTLNEKPDRFVAYNNGLTATASYVETNEKGWITRLDDLQIVNGGQTTASIFYTEQKDKTDLSQVIIPVKLVVVHEDVARNWSRTSRASPTAKTRSRKRISLPTANTKWSWKDSPGRRSRRLCTIQTHW